MSFLVNWINWPSCNCFVVSHVNVNLTVKLKYFIHNFWRQTNTNLVNFDRQLLQGLMMDRSIIIFSK